MLVVGYHDNEQPTNGVCVRILNSQSCMLKVRSGPSKAYSFITSRLVNKKPSGMRKSLKQNACIHLSNQRSVLSLVGEQPFLTTRFDEVCH
jgi:hypothetical protein